MSKNKIWKDEVEIHDWDTWCEYYEDTDNNLDDGTWYEIYMSGYGEGQRVTKKMIIKDVEDMIEKLPLFHNDYFKKKDVIQIIQELKNEWEVK